MTEAEAMRWLYGYAADLLADCKLPASHTDQAMLESIRPKVVAKLRTQATERSRQASTPHRERPVHPASGDEVRAAYHLLFNNDRYLLTRRDVASRLNVNREELMDAINDWRESATEAEIEHVQQNRPALADAVLTRR